MNDNLRDFLRRSKAGLPTESAAAGGAVNFLIVFKDRLK
jgi:hypothetical protein